MRKFWGWALFILSWFDAGIIFYNFALAPWKDNLTVDWLLLPYLFVLGLCLFGWYKLIICNTTKELNNAKK